MALYVYPRRFRQTFGDELWQTARDSLEAAHATRSPAQVARAWLSILLDLARSAALERMSSMRPSIVIALVMTGVAFIVSLLASLNLYLLEDGNPLTAAAYRASPLLRVSYDGAYLSALAATVAVCAVALCALLPGRAAPLGASAAIALVVALGGFGGLLVRAPLSFLVLFVSYIALLLLCLLVGWFTASRLRRGLSARVASIIGACAGVGMALLANVASLAPHTLALNPVSHGLYMQGQIPGTHYNALLIGLAVQLLTALLCALALVAALRAPTRSRLA